MRRASGALRLGALVTLLPAVVAGCGRAAAPGTAGLERITFASPAYLTSVVGQIAAEEGYFAEQGLDVRFVLWNREGNTIPSLSEGGLDVASTGPLAPRYFNVIGRGGAIRFVAARSVYAVGGCPYSAFVARAELLDSGRLTDAASLAGLRASTERGTSDFYIWRRLLDPAGLSTGDLRLVDVPTVAKIDAYAKDLLDVSIVSEPWTTRMLEGGHARIWKPTSDVLPDHQNTFLLFGRRLLEERRDLGARFLAAYQKAARRYLDEGKSERHLEIVERLTRIDRATLLRTCWPPWSRDGRIDRRSIEEYQRWAFEEGLIDRELPYEQLVDESFLDAAEALAVPETAG